MTSGRLRWASPSQTMPWHTETQSNRRGHLAAGLQQGGGRTSPTHEAAAKGARREPGGALCSPKMLWLFRSRRPPLGSAQIAAGAALGWEQGPSMHKEQSRAGREGAFVVQPVAPCPPRPPLGSQGGDELRQLRLRLLPLLSLGERPGQGRTIVLPGSCGAPGLRSHPSGGHVPSLLCGVRPPEQQGEGAAGPWQVWPCQGLGSCTRRGRGGDKASPQSHLLGEQGPSASLWLAAPQPGSVGRDKGTSRPQGSCSSAG